MKNKIYVLVALFVFLGNIEVIYSGNLVKMDNLIIVHPSFWNVPTRPTTTPKLNEICKTPEIYQFQQKTPEYLQF